MAEGFCAASLIFSPLIALCAAATASISYCKQAIDAVKKDCPGDESQDNHISTTGYHFDEVEVFNQLSIQPHQFIMVTSGSFLSQSTTSNDAIEKVNSRLTTSSLTELIKQQNRLAAEHQESLNPWHSEKYVRGKATQGLNRELLHQVAESIASAVNYLHTVGNPPILHMNISPENILITEEGTVKLTGFEKALFLYSDGLRDQQYLPFDFCKAPELHQQGGLPSRKADIWSYGSMLYEAATGEKLCLFKTQGVTVELESQFSIIQFMTTMALANPKLLNPENTELRDLLKKVLAVRPENRPFASEVLQHPYIKHTP
ncbi:protein kinase domain-containing protein [Endozoicomonas arenosclerae]|uniref:protein kinase domain-containing protein n=1 Tax=Endozoicomonas arenosclerae TaxID=1633495 RepID=UPI000786662F|nr:protein kinase [Endozoicomonas arenosclerae]